MNPLFKTESIRAIVWHASPYRTLEEVEFATAHRVAWYNNRRLHGALRTVNPIELETVHDETLTREPKPAK